MLRWAISRSTSTLMTRFAKRHWRTVERRSSRILKLRCERWAFIGSRLNVAPSIVRVTRLSVDRALGRREDVLSILGGVEVWTLGGKGYG